MGSRVRRAGSYRYSFNTEVFTLDRFLNRDSEFSKADSALSSSNQTESDAVSKSRTAQPEPSYVNVSDGLAGLDGSFHSLGVNMFCGLDDTLNCMAESSASLATSHSIMQTVD